MEDKLSKIPLKFLISKDTKIRLKYVFLNETRPFSEFLESLIIAELNNLEGFGWIFP